jgi:hypothetical protein
MDNKIHLLYILSIIKLITYKSNNFNTIPVKQLE